MCKISFSLLSLLLVTLLFTSCATSGFTLTGEKYPPYEGVVKVFYSIPENIKYEQIGILSSQGGEIHQWTSLIKAMQKKAAKNGANAIIILGQDKDDKAIISYTPQTGLFGSTTKYKNMEAIAIRIVEWFFIKFSMSKGVF